MPCLAKFLIPNKPNPRQRLPPPPPLLSLGQNQPNNPHYNHNTIFHQLRSTTDSSQATKLHGLLLVNGFLHQNHSSVLGAQLVNTYVNFDMVHEALLVFHRLPKRNSFAWNSILRGLVDVGRFLDVVEYYHCMLEEGVSPDNFTYPLVMKACSRLCMLEEGRRIQELIENSRIHRGDKPNVFVQCAAIDMFAKCGSLDEARRVFDDMPIRDLVSWGAMICGTMQVGDWAEALRLFWRMRSEGFGLDSVIVAMVVPACGRLGDLMLGMGLQSCALKIGVGNDLCMLNALIDMYCKCGYTNLAHQVFQGMECKDVVTWSSLIAGYSQNCEFDKSLHLYAEMVGSGISPSSMTLASVLPSFSERKLLKEGKEIHAYAIRHEFELDAFVSSALVDLYCQCGSLSQAQIISEIIQEKDIAIWNSMITGYALEGDITSAFELLHRIQEFHVKPNCITVVTVLPICAGFTMLRQGKELHCYIIRSCLNSASSVSNSLIDMYCKCGCLGFGRKVFEKMIDRNTVSYNTIIVAVGMHGNVDSAISYFQQMNIERIRPDKVTFIALLSACSHGGLIDKGLMFYKSMMEDHGILPDMEHFSCMVDLYSRSGYVDDAWQFIKTMPMEPNIDVLGSLLGACRVHKRTDLAEIVGKWIFEKKPKDPGYYVLLSNIYAAAGRWADETKVRMIMKEKGLMKIPGTSWIQVGSSVHYFIAQGRSHTMFDNVCEMLEDLYFQMKDEGYLCNISYFHDEV